MPDLKIFQQIEREIKNVPKKYCVTDYLPQIPEDATVIGSIEGDLLKLWGLANQLRHELAQNRNRHLTDMMDPSLDPEETLKKFERSVTPLSNKLNQIIFLFELAVKAEFSVEDLDDSTSLLMCKGGVVVHVPKEVVNTFDFFSSGYVSRQIARSIDFPAQVGNFFGGNQDKG